MYLTKYFYFNNYNSNLLPSTLILIIESSFWLISFKNQLLFNEDKSD